jgi:predicted nucleic acid-binding protein
MVALTTLVDTSVLIDGKDTAELQMEGGWAVSAIAVGELHAGVLMAADPGVRAARLKRLTTVLELAPVVDVDQAVAASFGQLRAAGRRAATNDLWIAATALAHDLTLLTGDARQAALPLVRAKLLARS